MEREQIIKALEWCIQSESCEYCEYKSDEDVCSIRSDALSIIKEQEEKIFELENRLKECENGYEGTLHLERAKVKELAEENDKLSTALAKYDHQPEVRISEEYVPVEAYEELQEENEKLREENERLKAENKAAVDDLKDCMYFAKPKNNNTCNFCSHECEGGMCRGREDWIECSPVWRGVVKSKSDGEG